MYQPVFPADDLRDSDPVIAIDGHHFTMRNHAIAHNQLDTFAGAAVQFQQRSGNQFERVIHFQGRSPEGNSDGYFDIQ